MFNRLTPELPPSVAALLHDLDGALGAQLIGVFLFGSRARGDARRESDWDLAVIVADAGLEQSRQAIWRALSLSDIDESLRTFLALNVESYLSLKDALKHGDPFAWVICGEGRILKDRANMLAELQKSCRSTMRPPDREAVKVFLQQKCRSQYDVAMSSYQQFLSAIQLSVMAGAQAVAADRMAGEIGVDQMFALASWENLKKVLATSATLTQVEAIERLIFAQKKGHKNEAESFGKDIFESVNTAGKLWKALLRWPTGGGDSERA